MKIRKTSKRPEGFSLVEIALALGIIGVALTSMLGLMPIGLNTFRDSIASTVRTDVLRELGAQFQSTPFDKLTNDPGMAMLFYSDQGIKVTNSFDGLIGVTYEVDDSTKLLDGANASYDNSRLKRVTVHFYTREDRAKNPPSPSYTEYLFVPPGTH